jgi:hypothetical protein
MTKLTSLAPLAWGVLLGLFATSTLAFKVFGDKPNCVVSLDKQKVLYIGVDNPLTMVVRGVPADQVVIKTEGLSLKVDSTGLDHYIAHYGIRRRFGACVFSIPRQANSGPGGGFKRQ